MPRRLARHALLAWLLVSCGGAIRPAQSPGAAVSTPSDSVAWSGWEAQTFARARRENRPILLSVQAGWCHWCHVMNDTTYRDPEVRRLIEAGFVAVRTDSDARPDLAERYARYGWPATVFLTPDGQQILGLRGYQSTEAFTEILGRVRRAHDAGERLDDPIGGGAGGAEDLAALRASLIEQLDATYDETAGGWGRTHRYPLSAPIEHAFFRLRVRGETVWRERALFSLERYAQLIDPVFGGMYQYSVPEVWDRPHFEKIVPVQAGAIRAFCEAYRVSGEPRWLEHAEAVHGYLSEFLRADDGAFYASQNADLGGHGEAGPRMAGADYYALDDAARRAQGIPRVDTHVYAESNGRIIAALAQLSLASGRRRPLAEAIAASDRIVETHRRGNGLYAHDATSDDPLFYLADQAHMLDALLALRQVTGQARYQTLATQLANAMVEHLRNEAGGFVAHTEDPRAAGFFRERRVPIADGAVAVRGLLVLARLEQDHDAGDRWRERATAALRACARPGELRAMGRMIGELIMALELHEEGHVMLSVVGPNERRETHALHRAALDLYEPTSIVEVGRPGESRYPYPDEPALFLCTNNACSMPVTDPDELASAAAQFLQR